MAFQNKKASYSSFSEKGGGNLPDEIEISSYLQQGLEPVIFLDSCVCLHLAKVVDYGKGATNVDFDRIISLKEYLEAHEIRIDPFFGLMEICTKGNTIDERKLWDLKARIDFFQEIPLKKFKQFQYDFSRDCFVVPPLNPLPESAWVFDRLLKNTYCALLKIRSLASKGLTKTTALNNVEAFLKWMIEDLDIILSVEYKLALNIFGGNTQFRKMVGIDCKQSEVKKKIRGTCWDIFHSRYTSSSFRLSELFDRNIYPFFITSDTNLFALFENFSLTLINEGDENHTSSFLLNSDFNYPHFDESFIDIQNGRMIKTFADRHMRKYEFNEVRVERLINELEQDNDIL